MHLYRCRDQSAVYLSDRYIAGRFLPDKAIDLLDEAGAKARIAMMHQPQDITKFEAEIEEVRLAKEEAIGKQEYEKAAKLRDKEKTLREQLQQIRAEWESNKEEHQVIVDEEEVASIVAKQTGIPLTRLTEGETTKVLKMEEALKANIIGQDEAVSTVCRAIRRSRADIKDPNRPIGAFLFLGPTGVGKTLLAKQLAINMFGGEDALIQVDMSEYMEKFADQPHDRISSRICGPRRRRPAHRTSAPAPLLRRPLRRSGKSAPRCDEPPPPNPRRRAPHRFLRPQDRLPQYDHHHDLQPRRRPDPQIDRSGIWRYRRDARLQSDAREDRRRGQKSTSSPSSSTASMAS